MRRLLHASVPLLCVLSASLLVSVQSPAEDAGLLVAAGELAAGGRSSVTVTAFDASTRAPLARPLVVNLLHGDEVVLNLFSGATGTDGHVRIPFDVPRLASGAYSIEARIAGIADPLRISTTVSSAPAILIETDKPIYKPAQTIQGRVLLIDNALRPVTGDVEVTFHDAKGIRIDRRRLSANEFGAAAFSLDLAREVNFGTWKIRAVADGVESVRDVRVEEYTLPRYDLAVAFERGWMLPDERLEGTVSARYFFGRDVEGTARVSARRWIGEWEEYARIEGELAGGELSFALPPVGFVAGSPAQGGQGAVTVEVEVVDSTGHAQSISEVLTVTESSIVLGLVPRVRSIKPGIAAPVLVTARTPDGLALDAPVETVATYFDGFGSVLREDREAVAVKDGIGEVSLMAPEGTFYARVTARAERDGRGTTTEVQIGGAFSETGGFISIARAGGEGPVDPGATVSFSVAATHPGTIYYEVYAGGRTVFASWSETERFSFAVTPEMAPKARVVAYAIQPNNEVAADSLTLDVRPALSIAIEAAFDHTPAKPGDPIRLTLDAGTGGRTLIGLSVVDQSVLALGRSRLHLAEVFGELERRFLEPRVEVHEEGGGPEGDALVGGPAFGGPGFAPPSSAGALDILEEAGLVVASTPNVTIARGALFRGGFADDAVLEAAPGADPDGGSSAPPDAVRVRQYFPETWVWEPLLLTDETGRAVLDLTVPDSITGWRLAAVGSSAAGIGFGEAELITFQDFFVEPSLPYDVTRGEEFPVKIDIFNYLDSAQEVALRFGSAEWYELLGDSDLSVTIPAGSASSVHFPIRPLRTGEHTVEVTAIGSKLSDAVRRTIRVVPEGLPVEAVSNHLIEAGATHALDVTIPAEAVEGSARAYLHVTPSPVAQTMQGVSDLLSMPYGCGEQNMIFLAPDIEILKYLREIGELSTEIRAQAEYYVNVGYQRELTFQTDDGGFAAFGGAEGSLWLTAFVLSTFSGAREVRDIDEGVLARAASMLVSRQNADGSFRTDDFLIHQEMDGGLENLFAMTAYVTKALSEYTRGIEAAPEVGAALEKAAGYLRDRREQVADDAYSQSIAAVALLEVPGFRGEGEALVDRLLELALDGGAGIHWEPYPVETTGYAASALLIAGRPEAGAAVDWLSTQRNALGGYGASTQDTVVAIRALFLAARTVRRDLSLDLELVSEDGTLWSLHLDEENFDLLHSVELPLGGKGIELRASGTGSSGYQVVRRYHVPGVLLPPSRDMLIEVDYETEGIEVDDILDVRVRLVFTGFKEETGMVIADIGVPTGFGVVRPSLDALVDGGIVSRTDVAGRSVIFYLDGLTRDVAVEFVFQLRALYPVRAEGPVSRAYEYYDPDVGGYDGGEPIIITPPEEPERTFVRGDSNRDRQVDIADAVATLTYLFAGKTDRSGFRCADAADTNDDGRLELTDPIYLLNHLFQGGPAPSPPYPEPGVDSTADDLGCGT